MAKLPDNGVLNVGQVSGMPDIVGQGGVKRRFSWLEGVSLLLFGSALNAQKLQNLSGRRAGLVGQLLALKLLGKFPHLLRALADKKKPHL